MRLGKTVALSNNFISLYLRMADSNKTKTALIIVTVASIIISVCPLLLWMQVVNANTAATQEQKQKLFLQKLPFTNLNTVSYLMLLFAIVAAVAAAMWRKRCTATEKIIATVVLIVSCLLTLLCLFQLM